MARPYRPDRIPVHPLYIEETGQPGPTPGTSIHRFHLPHIDAWGTLVWTPRPDGIADHGYQTDRHYLAAALEERLGIRSPNEGKRWIAEHPEIEVPRGWRPNPHPHWGPEQR